MLRLFPLLAALFLSMPAAQAQDSAPKVDGQIRKIDAAAGKLTIRHGGIANLQMPAMTMVFRAAPEIVGQVREGEQVRFTADRIDGALTVTSLEEKR